MNTGSRRGRAGDREARVLARKPRGCRGCIRAVSSHSAAGQGARLPPVQLPLLALVGQHTRRLGRFTHWLRSAV
jgi:hypothetical protein